MAGWQIVLRWVILVGVVIFYIGRRKRGHIFEPPADLSQLQPVPQPLSTDPPLHRRRWISKQKSITEALQKNRVALQNIRGELKHEAGSPNSIRGDGSDEEVLALKKEIKDLTVELQQSVLAAAEKDLPGRLRLELHRIE